MVIPAASAQYSGRQETIPLPLTVKEEAVKTGIHLRLNTYEFNLPLSRIVAAARNENTPEFVLYKLLLTIHNSRQDDFEALTEPRSRESAAQTFRLYQTTFSGQKDPVVIRRHDVGNLAYFVLASSNKQTPFIPVLLLQKDGRWFQSWGEMGHPLVQTLNSLTRARARNLKRFSPATYGDFAVAIDLPDLFGAKGKNRVEVLLRGKRLNFSVLAAEQGTDIEEDAERNPGIGQDILKAITVYRRSCKSLADGNIDRFFASFDDQSQAKIKKYIDQLTRDNALDEFVRMMEMPRKIVFVAESEEIMVLFTRSTSPIPRQQDSVSYDYLRHRDGDNDVRVNFAIIDPLDQLLRWDPVAKRIGELTR